MSPAGRVPDPSELADDLARIEAAVEAGNDRVARKLDALAREIASTYMRQDVYTANHNALRSEVALELAAIKSENATTRGISTTARTLATWCLGVLATAVVIALVGFLATGAPT